MASRIRRALLAAVAFAIGFGGLAALFHWISGPAATDASLRADWLRENGAGFDTIFLGSSRTARQVMPEVFDRAMADTGRPTRSFNLGSAGMRAPEDDYVLEIALAGRRVPLQILVLECNPLRLGIPDQDRGTTRAVYWHDTARLGLLWERVWAHRSDAPNVRLGVGVVTRNLLEFADHLQHWLSNTTRLGRGAALLAQALGGARPAPRPSVLGPGGDGYDPGRLLPSMHGEERERYLAEIDAAMREGKRIHYGDTASQTELLRKRAVAARYGARLVLVAPPVTGEAFAPLPASGLVFLDFSDPRRYPELFAVEHRNDRGHLNRAGARIYSRLLAREVAPLLRAAHR